MRRSAFVLCVILSLLVNAVKPDVYLEEVENRCAETKRIFVCAKYRALKYLSSFEGVNNNGSALVRLIKISEPVGNGTDGLFANARQFSNDLEVTKLFKFCQRQFGRFVSNFGVAVALPEGVRMIDSSNRNGNARGSSGTGGGGLGGGGGGGKKSDMLIPLLILFKLFKIKVLVAVVLVGVVFIKKTILLAAIVLPTFLHAIKSACKASYHVVPHPISDDVYHDTHHHEHVMNPYGYGRDWDRNYNPGYMEKRYHITI